MSQKALYNIRNQKARKRASHFLYDNLQEFESLTDREITELQADARLKNNLPESLKRFLAERKLTRPQIAFALRKAVYERDGNQCTRCGSLVDLTLHHLRPISRKGSTAYDNLQTLCLNCHRASHHMSRGVRRDEE